MPNFWGPKKDKKVINSYTKCLISVKIATLTPHIIPLPLVNIWLILDLQKYVNWLCVFLEVNPCFQRAHVFCMDLQPAADPYNVVCNTKTQWFQLCVASSHSLLLQFWVSSIIGPSAECEIIDFSITISRVTQSWQSHFSLVRLAQLWNHVAVYHYRLTYGRYFC